MGKATQDWDNAETWKRLVAAIYASGVKVDTHATAKYFGATYDTVENRLRKIKKDAKELKDEVDSGDRGEVTPVRRSVPSTPKKVKTPKKTGPLDTVTNGRVTKGTPSKKKAVKQEQLDGTGSSFMDMPQSSFNQATVDYDNDMMQDGFGW